MLVDMVDKTAHHELLRAHWGASPRTRYHCAQAARRGARAPPLPPSPEPRIIAGAHMSFLDSRTRTAREGFGKPVRRQEDPRLLVGGGCYSDDVNLPGQAYACFVRSPHAHARIGRVEIAAALATSGVLAVLTGQDAAADGVGPITHRPMPSSPHEVMIRDGDVAFIAPHPPMPADRVRFVGEIVAMVVAQTPAAARDGADRVVVEWAPLPAVASSLAAAAPGAPLLYEGRASNVCVDARAGDPAAVEAAFSHAAHVVRLETWVHRVTGVPLEPRAAVGVWGAPPHPALSPDGGEGSNRGSSPSAGGGEGSEGGVRAGAGGEGLVGRYTR